MLVMWGISAGFIHGVGFVPQHWLWRLLFHPAAAWLLMGQGYLMLLPDGAPGLVSG
jgi:predicted membrane protein